MQTNNKDATEKAEQLGRMCFELNYPSYVKDYSTNQFDWWDVSGYTSTSTTKLTVPQPYIAEIKIRNGKSEKYKTYMIEKYKYEQLMNYTQTSGIPSFYINYFDNQRLIANLKNIDLNECEAAKMWLPEYSLGSDEPEYKLKDVYNIPRDFFDIKDGGSAYFKLKSTKC